MTSTLDRGAEAADGQVVTVDVLVVGAGPTGLFAAYYAGLRALSCAIVDSLPDPGGQVSALYPEKLIFDVAGMPAVKGRDLVALLVEQAARFSPTYLLGQRADELARDGDALVVTTSTGAVVRCRAVIVTGGIGTFTPRPMPGCGQWEGRGLTFTVRELADHAGHDVLIVGGGDSAVDWALALEPLARSVTLVHRRSAFRAHAASVEQLKASGVTLHTDTQVAELTGGERVEKAVLRHKKGGETQVSATSVIAALGFLADLGPLERWGLTILDRRLAVDSRMATAVPGVYAAGDITDYPGKVRLIAVGFGEAATAVNNAAIHLDPDAELEPGHSSDSPPA